IHDEQLKKNVGSAKTSQIRRIIGFTRLGGRVKPPGDHDGRRGRRDVSLTIEQVLALAPDASAAAAGRKLATAKPWRMLGQNARALWGECQGSAVYQVRVDRNDMVAKCSCPSR